MWDIIAIDISGRHRIRDGYYLVCAAAALSVSADHIEKIKQVAILPRWLKGKEIKAPQLPDIVQLIEDTVAKLDYDGTLVTEKGDLYNQPLWVSESMFSGAFKYQESMAERRAIELAHHISLSARNLLLKELNIEAGQ
ncbi:MAG: DUF2209 domain-containing protein [Methanosarcinaceae archaeon]|nr:DUF2209 domain-containing protein [Methanosarcinaceae archaeon]